MSLNDCLVAIACNDRSELARLLRENPALARERTGAHNDTLACIAVRSPSMSSAMRTAILEASAPAIADIKSDENWSVLALCVALNAPRDVRELLVRLGARWTCESCSDAQTALYWALTEKRRDLVQEALEQAEFLRLDESGFIDSASLAFTDAVHRGDAECIKTVFSACSSRAACVEVCVRALSRNSALIALFATSYASLFANVTPRVWCCVIASLHGDEGESMVRATLGAPFEETHGLLQCALRAQNSALVKKCVEIMYVDANSGISLSSYGRCLVCDLAEHGEYRVAGMLVRRNIAPCTCHGDESYLANHITRVVEMERRERAMMDDEDARALVREELTLPNTESVLALAVKHRRAYLVDAIGAELVRCAAATVDDDGSPTTTHRANAHLRAASTWTLAAWWAVTRDYVDMWRIVHRHAVDAMAPEQRTHFMAVVLAEALVKSKFSATSAEVLDSLAFRMLDRTAFESIDLVFDTVSRVCVFSGQNTVFDAAGFIVAEPCTCPETWDESNETVQFERVVEFFNRLTLQGSQIKIFSELKAGRCRTLCHAAACSTLRTTREVEAYEKRIRSRRLEDAP